MKTLALPMPRVFKRLARDRRGVSAVEFALVAPFMIALYLGCVEISDAVSANRKVSMTSAALANLTAQATTILSGDMDNIFNAATKIMSPYSATPLQMTISCILIDANKVPTVKWSAVKNGTPLTTGALAIPSDLTIANTQLVLGQVTYTYTPTIGNSLTGPLALKDQMYMSPRITAPTYNDGTDHKCNS